MDAKPYHRREDASRSVTRTRTSHGPSVTKPSPRVETPLDDDTSAWFCLGVFSTDIYPLARARETQPKREASRRAAAGRFPTQLEMELEMRVAILAGLGVWLTALSAFPEAVHGQQPGTTADAATLMISEAAFDDLLKRVDSLETTVDGSVHRQVDVEQEQPEETNWETSWGGRVMIDYVTWADQDAGYGGGKTGRNYLELRRARFCAKGEGFGHYFWKIELDFAADDDSSAQYNAGSPGLINVGPVVEMKDVYLGMHEVPLLGEVLIGHFKAPFSMEELTSSRHTTFMERALPNAFAPSRDIGVAAYNSTPSEHVTWAFGVFSDALPESTKQLTGDMGTQWVGRATWTPCHDELSDGRRVLHLGTGIRHVQTRGEVYRLRVRPETHESIRVIDFDGDPADRADQRTVYNAELAWIRGPFSIQAEGFVDNVDVAAGGDVNAYGAYSQASYFLTGENRVYKRSQGRFGRVKPFENFQIARGAPFGPGAWELKMRWSYIDVNNLYAAGLTGDTHEDADRVNNLAAGINWYWNPYTRITFDYWHSWSKRHGAAADEADLLGLRMQYDF